MWGLGEAGPKAIIWGLRETAKALERGPGKTGAEAVDGGLGQKPRWRDGEDTGWSPT